jgi:ribosomal-protein-alanine N-acetyltransferase
VSTGNIRRARVEDLPSILRIERRSFGAEGWNREVFLAYFGQAARSLLLVSIEDGAISGYVLAFIRGSHPEIDSIAVDPKHRQRGVAAALLKRIISILRRRGFATIFLSVRIDNEPAIRLYRKLGFRRVRLIESYYKPGTSAVRMRLGGSKSLQVTRQL